MPTLTVKKWSDKFETGIRAIDNDHKGLFEDIRYLGEAMAKGAEASQIDNAIGALEAYCRDHFGREETFMIGARYPETESHIKEHRRMTDQIARLRTLYKADPDQIDPQKVLAFLSNWLLHHILEKDMRYIPFLRGRGTAATDSEPKSLRTVSITIPESESKVVGGFVRILESGHPVAQELARAIAKFEDRLEREQIENARDLFCRT